MEENIKYPNINLKVIYKEFKEEYNKEIKKLNVKKYFSLSFYEWLENYIKSDVALNFIIILISLLICDKFIGGIRLYRYLLRIYFPVLILCSIMDYSVRYSEKEKLIADFAIEKVLTSNNIKLTSNSFEILVKKSSEIGNEEIKILKQVKDSSIYVLFKKIFLLFSGILIGFITNEINEEGAKKVTQNFSQLFNILLQSFFYIFCFYIIIYYVYTIINRTWSLYLHVLEEKIITIELQNTR